MDFFLSRIRREIVGMKWGSRKWQTKVRSTAKEAGNTRFRSSLPWPRERQIRHDKEQSPSIEKNG
jgi:hypothetical protein